MSKNVANQKFWHEVPIQIGGSILVNTCLGNTEDSAVLATWRLNPTSPPRPKIHRKKTDMTPEIEAGGPPDDIPPSPPSAK
ncbi:hypothetical protein TNCV_4040201 [Trichonephila clavipes]|nr:hypothetical protein TNCV_4040201 [Trichonephila clavipes]